MGKVVFESKLLPDGHLYCPEKLAQKKNTHFKVIATFDGNYLEANDLDVELSALNDVSEDFLSEEELSYYLKLKEL